MNPSYLLIGSGRLARHMEFYLKSVGLEVATWNRKNGSALEPLVNRATHVWILISDSSIESFVLINEKLWKSKILLHASGALTLKSAESVHPLASFSENLFEPSFYSQIPFITEAGRTPFQKLFLGLKNPSSQTSSDERAYYHAVCVAAGNFTSILWNEAAKRFENRLGLQASLLVPFLESITRNLKADIKGSLTGPISRGDVKTIQMNLEALKGDPLEDLYRSFLKLKGLKLIGSEPPDRT